MRRQHVWVVVKTVPSRASRVSCASGASRTSRASPVSCASQDSRASRASRAPGVLNAMCYMDNTVSIGVIM